MISTMKKNKDVWVFMESGNLEQLRGNNIAGTYVNSKTGYVGKANAAIAPLQEPVPDPLFAMYNTDDNHQCTSLKLILFQNKHLKKLYGQGSIQIQEGNRKIKVIDTAKISLQHNASGLKRMYTLLKKATGQTSQ